MKELSSGYGRVFIGPREDCFRTAVFLAEGQRGRNPAATRFTCALPGGSTAQDWFRWCAGTEAFSPAIVARTHWFASDERYVRIDSYESNFGNADRLLLRPLGVPPERKHPWSTGIPPGMAALEFGRMAAPFLGRGRTFDICYVGMGEDGHIASMFPGCPLLRDDGGHFFAAVDVPEKSWRLTITPSGLRAAGMVVVLVLGSRKADALHRILSGPYDPVANPAQIVKTCSQNVVWLVDDEAAARFLQK
jgi:6-phosphogluconolactonase